MGNVPFVDATGIFAIEEIVRDFQRHGATVLLVEVRPNVRFKLERSGVIEHIGKDNVMDTMEHALPPHQGVSGVPSEQRRAEAVAAAWPLSAASVIEVPSVGHDRAMHTV